MNTILKWDKFGFGKFSIILNMNNNNNILTIFMGNFIPSSIQRNPYLIAYEFIKPFWMFKYRKVIVYLMLKIF